MKQTKLIIVILAISMASVFYCQADAKYDGGIVCKIDGLDFQNSEPKFFEIIQNKEDKDYLNGIIQHLSIKIKEINNKQQAGERLLEALSNKKEAFDGSFAEWQTLRSQFKQRYSQLSYSETIKMRELILQKESDVRLKGADYDNSVEKLNTISKEIKNSAEDIKNLRESFINKINQIDQKRSNSTDQYSAKSLSDYFSKGEPFKDICQPT